MTDPTAPAELPWGWPPAPGGPAARHPDAGLASAHPVRRSAPGGGARPGPGPPPPPPPPPRRGRR
jgi:hypothetical protein